jgi:hypothetical protein
MTRLAALRRSFPTFRVIVSPIRWIGRSRRRIWTAVLVLLTMIAIPPLWWAAQLLGLPDVGEPFDVKAFRAFTIPDDRNAFVFYRQAAAVLKPVSDFEKKTSSEVDLLARSSKADPGLRRWVEANREALALYRQGSERPDALDRDIAPDRENWATFHALRSFRLLVLLEGSRLQEQGDMAGAWGWYRAMLRTLHHVGMHGTAIRRLVAQSWNKELRDRLATWAADKRTTPALLRQALEDVVACELLAPSETDTLKGEYLAMDRALDEPKGPGSQRPPAWLISFASRPFSRPVMAVLLALLTPEQMRSGHDAWRFWRREPERSRRVLRLVMANWLAYYALRPEDRPKLDLNTTSAFDFYSFGSEAPAKARVLSPEALGRWLDSTHDALVLLSMLALSRIRVDEWANHWDLLILLGTQLYRRDHGTDPPTPEALVGPYLKSLPSEFPDDQKDESIPEAGSTDK